MALFERHRTGYALTAAGEEMVALAERMDEDVTAFARKLAGRQLSPAGELRVTTSDTLLVHLLTPLFARFRGQCPDVRLDIVLGNQALNLSKRDADVAIRATDSPPETLVGRRVGGIALGALRPGRGLPATRRRPACRPPPPCLGLARRRPCRPEGGTARPRARSAGAHRLPGQHRARAGRGGGSRDRRRPPSLLHRRRSAGAGASPAPRARSCGRPVAAHPTPTCAARRGSGSSSISWPRRLQSGALIEVGMAMLPPRWRPADDHTGQLAAARRGSRQPPRPRRQWVWSPPRPPGRGRQMVGPFIFFDQMGPGEFLIGQGSTCGRTRTSAWRP